MKLDKKQLLLYAVTDRAWVGRQTLEEQVEEALNGGVTMLQLREKNLPEEEFLREAKRIKEICNRYGVPFIVNDNVEVSSYIGKDKSQTCQIYRFYYHCRNYRCHYFSAFTFGWGIDENIWFYI